MKSPETLRTCCGLRSKKELKMNRRRTLHDDDRAQQEREKALAKRLELMARSLLKMQQRLLEIDDRVGLLEALVSDPAAVTAELLLQ
jgi:hypothetical protein